MKKNPKKVALYSWIELYIKRVLRYELHNIS